MSQEPVTSYKTVSEPSESEFRDRGSRFFGYLIPVADRESLEVELANLRQLHPKSRHVCYAYRLGRQKMNEIDEYANDAGEPSGSAGMPILHALRSAEIIQVMGVVVRYFGGTKLGIPGLINAYRTCMSQAIAANRIAIREVMVRYTVTAGFEHGHRVYPLVEQFHGQASQDVDHDRYIFDVHLPLQYAEPFTTAVEESFGLSIDRSPDA